MNLKKIFFVLLVNSILLVLLLALFSFYIFHKETSGSSLSESYKYYKEFLNRDISEENRFNSIIDFPDYRRVENPDSPKGSILIFGCSFAYGTGIEETETLSYKLGKLTGRPVYNRAYSGFGVQHMLYQLQNDKFYEKVPKPEYIIYVYFDGHPQRMTTPVTLSFPAAYTVFYKRHNDKFILKKRTFFSDKFIVPHYLSNWFGWNILNRFSSFNRSREKLIIEYLKESKKESEKHWKNNDIKYFVLFYNSPFFYETLDELHKLGFETLTDEEIQIDVQALEYKISETDDHPSGFAWDVIVPHIIEKLNL